MDNNLKKGDIENSSKTRRRFLKKGIYLLLGALGGGVLFHLWRNKKSVFSSEIRFPKQIYLMKEKKGNVLPKVETKYYTTLKDRTVICGTCFRECVVEPGERGFCLSRINVDGKYYTLTYGRPSALQIDPVEKEPSFHLLPGMSILCTGTACCTNRCKFCHNWHLSQTDIYDIGYYELPPEHVVSMAKSNKREGLSFTYNEPTVFFEFMLDIMKIAKKEGLKLLFHTNGGLKEGPLKDLLRLADAVTVDLKGFTERFYSDVSSSSLSPVIETLKRIKAANVHLEIVNLVIPSLNDDMGNIKRMCHFIRDKLGKSVPLHFTRFFPNYKLRNLPPTPISTLEKAREIAKGVGLEFVYIGNVPGHEYNSTFCPKCGNLIIKRTHFEVKSNKIQDGRCSYCNLPIPGVWG